MKVSSASRFPSEVRAGRFREDLFYRLNVFTMGKRIQNIPRGNLDALLAYAWPGNIRELRNVIERAMIVSAGITLRPEVPVGGPSAPRKAGSRRLEEVERQHIRTVLEQAKWRIRGPGGAASVLGLKPTTLEGRLVKLGIKRPRVRRAER